MNAGRAGASAVSAAELDRFAAWITARLGLRIDALNQGKLREALAARAQERGASSAAHYLDRLDALGPGEIEALAEHLTVGESWFFRGPAQIEALRAAALPALLRARPPGQALRLLSAGCAGGEEAGTLAILFDEVAGRRSASASILGVDLNPAALQRARLGEYGDWQLREVPAPVKARAFHRRGKGFVMDEGLRARMSFEQRNLCEDDPLFFAPGRFDLILCRNVVIYFAPDPLRALIERLTRALAPGGYLFLAEAEALREPPPLLERCHSHGAFYYRRVSEAAGRCAPAPAVRADLPFILDLFRQERFVEAERALAQVAEGQRSPELLLVHAEVLRNMGRHDEAEALAHRVLAVLPRDPGAHFLLALCRERQGDPAGARRGHEATIRLDPGFALAHLHFGRLAREAGDPLVARREISKALDLLATEDAARLQLFGGGFPREALLDLCRSQLRGLGGDD